MLCKSGVSRHPPAILTHKHTGENYVKWKNWVRDSCRSISLAEGILINNIENERQTIYMWNDNHPESKKEMPLRTVAVQDVIDIAKQFNEFVNEK